MTPEPAGLEGAVFDAERVDRVLRAFQSLRHTQGKWAGRPLMPDSWQIAYILAPVFGWIREDESGDWGRVIRKLYVDVSRKNGKTTLAGGIAIYLTAADFEAGAQVYAVAASKDQARFCFDPVRMLADKAPALKAYMRPVRDRIVHPSSGSYFAVVSSMADLMHGANVHGAIIDELHVHKTSELLQAVESGTASRLQPLVATITTADEGRPNTPYDDRRSRIEQLARGAMVDMSTYGVVWAADPGDDPFRESTWKKANPGYGISPTKAFLESASREAQQSPSELAKFLRLHLGLRVTQISRFLKLEDWDRCQGPVDRGQLLGAPCYGGLDLSSTTDLTALALCFPPRRQGEDFQYLWRFWLPEAKLADRSRRDRVPYQQWLEEGWLEATEGNVVDYGVIRKELGELGRQFPLLREIGYDPWNATSLALELESDGFQMIPMRQGHATLSAPTKQLEKLVLGGRLRHGGNPVMRWMIDNVAVVGDSNGNIKPAKDKSRDRIDGVLAAIMALDRASRYQPSTYEENRLFVV